MRKLLTAVCLVAGLSAGTTVLSGCGEEDQELDATRSAAVTAQKGTARVAVTIEVTGAGLPLPVSVEGKGVTALDSAKGRVTFDLAPLLAFAGVPAGTPGELELRFGDGPDLFVKPPAVEQLEVPGGKPWVSVELAQLAAAFGVPTEGLSGLATLDPAAQVRALKAAKDVKRLGGEEVGGVQATHFRTTYGLQDLIAALPAAEREDARAALARLKELSPGSGLDERVTAEFWVDEDDIVRKSTGEQVVPAQGTTPAGSIRTTWELSDFGAPLDADAPPAGDVYDATSLLTDALGSLSGAGATP